MAETVASPDALQVQSDQPSPTGSQDLNSPYYFDKDAFSQLEAEMSIIPPDMVDGYRALEQSVSDAFVDMYGQFLNPQQVAYFRGTQILFTDPKTAGRFGSEWNRKIVAIDPKDGEMGGVSI